MASHKINSREVEYNMAEFRANMRQAFNEVDAGAVVIIERYGVNYHILRVPAGAKIAYAGDKMFIANGVDPVKNYSGLPSSCHCGDFDLPHSHLSDDGTSHNIKPDIPVGEV